MISARVFGCFLLALGAITWGFSVYIDSKMTLFTACMLALFGFAACIRLSANPDKLKNKHIVVTGCDSGIGLHLTKSLLSYGAVVYAGFLNTNCQISEELKKHYPDKIHCLKMDVTNDEQVSSCLEFVKSNLPAKGLWAIVNNAGIQFSGDVEMHTMHQIRQVMEVNYFGLIRVTKAFLPLLRQSRGRVINISSVRALTAYPFAGPYTATKFAVEAISDTLRLELSRFGVSVIIVQPGHFGGATGMLLDSSRIAREFNDQWTNASEEVRSAYGAEYCKSVEKAVLGGCQNSCLTLDPVTRQLLDALGSDAPQARYMIGGTNSRWIDRNNLIGRLRDLLPNSLHDALVSSIVFPNIQQPAEAVPFK